MQVLEEWYWKKGLHDAEIVEVTKHELNYDYTQKNPLRNFLEIKLNGEYAMFDTSISSIRLYNYKIIKMDSDLAFLKNSWWIKDSLVEENGKYKITLILRKEKQVCEIIILFDKAEVLR